MHASTTTTTGLVLVCAGRRFTRFAHVFVLQVRSKAAPA
jgi:hypothetical protein